jgi:hypothetical protein
MSAAGSVMGGLQANAQGKYEAKLAKRNAAAEVESARESIEIGKGERRQFWREIGQTKGQNIAAMAANGIDVDFGSGERLQSDTQMLANEDAANLYRNQQQRTQGYVVNASNYVEQAKAARAKGKAALVGGIIEGAGSLMSAASQMGKFNAKMKGG